MGVVLSVYVALDHVSKSFGSTDAVHDVCLEVSEGTIFGFLGPNGAGKSTTIRVLTGILAPDHGNVAVCGIKMAKDPVRAKAHVAYIPDEPYVYRYLTGREFLQFVGTVFNIASPEREKRIKSLQDVFPNMEAIDAPFYTYSRGTRQKLVFMAALLHQPDVFVIDEPMVGLDPLSARVVKDVLKHEVKSRGAAVFLSTHTLATAEEICDRVAIIDHGKLVAEGTLGELRHQTHQQHAGLEQVFLRLT